MILIGENMIIIKKEAKKKIWKEVVNKAMIKKV